MQIITEYTPNGTDLNVKYFTVTGSVAAKTTVTSAGVDLSAAGVIAPFLTPPPPNQPGPNTIANAVDERPTDAIWQNNRLSFVSTYPCTPTGDSTERDCVRISQLNTSTATPTLRQDFLIAENGKDSYMGGVGMAGNGTLHAVWSRSSATAGDFPSSYASYQLPTDAINTVSPKELLKAGTGVYTGERWGDYVGRRPGPDRPVRRLAGQRVLGHRRGMEDVGLASPAGRDDVRPDHPGAGPRLAVRQRACPASSRPRRRVPGRSPESAASRPTRWP